MSDAEKPKEEKAKEGGGVNGCTHCVKREKTESVLGVPLFFSTILIMGFFATLSLLMKFTGAPSDSIFFSIWITVYAGPLMIMLEAGVAFWPNIIGHYLYCFTDNAGQYHCHREVPPLTGFVVDGTARKADGTIAQIRNGGWFKTAHWFEIDGKTSPVLFQEWSIRSWNPKEDLCLVDSQSNVIHDKDDTPLIGEFLFSEVINCNSLFHLFGIIATLRKDLAGARERKDHFIRESGRLEGMSDHYRRGRDRLVSFLLQLLELIEKNKETKGKSKHAQEIRERIEECILKIGPSILDDADASIKDRLANLLKDLSARSAVLSLPVGGMASKGELKVPSSVSAPAAEGGV